MKNILVLLLLIFVGNIVVAQKNTVNKTTTREEQGKKENTDQQSQVKITPQSSGVKRSIGYRFNNTVTDSDPGDGIFRYNNNSVSGITYIYLDVKDISGADQTNWYSTWDSETGASGRGQLIIADEQGRNPATFFVTGVFVRGNGYWKIPVEYASGAIPANGAICYYVFNRIAQKDKQENRDKQPGNTSTVVAATGIAAVSQANNTTQGVTGNITNPGNQKKQDQADQLKQNNMGKQDKRETDDNKISQAGQGNQDTKLNQQAQNIQATDNKQANQTNTTSQIKQQTQVNQTTQNIPVTQGNNTQTKQQTQVNQTTQNKTVVQSYTAVQATQGNNNTQTRQQTQVSQSTQNLPVSQTNTSTKTNQGYNNQTTQQNTVTQKNQVSSSYQTNTVNNYNQFPNVQSISGGQGSVHRKWYRGIIELGYDLGVGGYGISNFKFNFINGFRIGPYASLGLGIGYRKYYYRNEEHTDRFLVSGVSQVPVFLDFRTTFSSKRLTPYLALGIGGSSSTGSGSSSTREEGLYFTASGGIWYNVSPKFAVFAGLAYDMQKLEFSDSNPFANNYTKNANSLGINIGISF